MAFCSQVEGPSSAKIVEPNKTDSSSLLCDVDDMITKALTLM